MLTVALEFFTETTDAYLLDGRFTVLGKVTRVLEDGEHLHLARRSAIGLNGPEKTRELVERFATGSRLPEVTVPARRHGRSSFTEAIDLHRSIVEPPAVQVMPLAVYV